MTDMDDMALNILLVEDNPAHAELIRRAFESQADHIHLDVAATLGTARTRLRDNPPQLAIVDLKLPDGDGVDLLANPLNGNAYPIMIMTSHGDEEAAVGVMKAGALNYIVKSQDTLDNMPRIAEAALREWHHLVERQKAEAALQASEQRFRALYDNHPSMFFTLDSQGKIVSANRFAAEHLGYTVDELVGSDFEGLCDPQSAEDVRHHIEQSFRAEGLYRWQSRQKCRGGELLWVRTTARTLPDTLDQPVVLLVCEDITETRRLSQELAYQASHDSLTSLFNRREFEARLQTALEDARIHQAEHAMCYLDLDQFKVINDTCGHLAGDMLLRQLGELLKTQIRKGDTVARLGGDEFGVLIQHCSVQDAQQVAETIRRLITQYRFTWDDKFFQIGVSIGVVPIGETSAHMANVMAAADRACYAAKDKGRNCIHLYRAGDAVLKKKRGEMRWIARIHQALLEERFRLYYQPIVPIESDASEKGEHYEVLIRMIDENQNLVSPGAFLPAAERYNMVNKLDHWVVASTLAWLGRHPRHLKNLHLCSINLSGQSLGKQDFLGFVTQTLSDSGIPPDKICFEITETAAIANLPKASKFIRGLKDIGCRFSLDDFGSGLSSFAYLKNLPVDFLKIDGIFVKDIVENPIDMAVVNSINEIGHVMGKKTIAEFVENNDILEKLQHMGVDYAQGYGIGRPQLLEGQA